MLSETLQQGLADYRIGDKLRALRLKKKMGLTELAKHTGLSPALLSKIERGRLFPTLPTLLRIALVFSVGLDFFFSGSREKPLFVVSRREERVTLPEQPGEQGPAFRFASLDYAAPERRFNAYHAEFLRLPKNGLRSHSHAGVEFIYVIEGRLQVQVVNDSHTLNAGDAAYFDATAAHAYSRMGSSRCTAIVVTAG